MACVYIPHGSLWGTDWGAHADTWRACACTASACHISGFGAIWLSLPGSLGWRGHKIGDASCGAWSVGGAGPQEVPSARHPLTSPSSLHGMLTRAHPQTVCGVHVWCSGAHAVRVWRACVSLSRVATCTTRHAALSSAPAGRVVRASTSRRPPSALDPLPSKPSLSSLPRTQATRARSPPHSRAPRARV